MTDQQFDRDSWQTPKYVFNWLDKRFNFDLDGAADETNKLCDRYCFDDGDGGFLSFDPRQVDVGEYQSAFYPKSIFVNPPYSDVTPFLKRAKFFRDELKATVVMLLNNDKSTQWYQNHIHNVANEVIDIIGGRIAFVHPVTGEEIKGNSKGQMVVVFDPTMGDFVQRTVSLDFIKKVGGYFTREQVENGKVSDD